MLYVACKYTGDNNVETYFIGITVALFVGFALFSSIYAVVYRDKIRKH